MTPAAEGATELAAGALLPETDGRAPEAAAAPEAPATAAADPETRAGLEPVTAAEAPPADAAPPAAPDWAATGRRVVAAAPV